MDLSIHNELYSEIKTLIEQSRFKVYESASFGMIQTYWQIGKRVAHLKRPSFFVLEGGYICQNVGADVDSFLRGYEENLK